MTLEEALAAAQVNDTGADEVITIDNDLRTIIIPASITLLGVVSDENVQTLHFQMPKTYKGLDLSEFAIRINYMNANNVGDTYAVDDSEISGEISYSHGQLDVWHVCIRVIQNSLSALRKRMFLAMC